MKITKASTSTGLLSLMLLALVFPMIVGTYGIESTSKSSAYFGLKIIDSDELFKAIQQSEQPVTVRMRTFWEFQGISREVVVIDPSQLTEKPLSDDGTHFGIRILNCDELFKAIQQSEQPVTVRMRTFWEFQGISREVVAIDPSQLTEKSLGTIEPDQHPYRYPISGSIAPSNAKLHGPYGAAISIEIDISWTPTDQACLVGIIDTQTGQGPSQMLYGGSGHAGWSTDIYRSYYVLVGNPSPPNMKTIAYSGQVAVWRLA